MRKTRERILSISVRRRVVLSVVLSLVLPALVAATGLPPRRPEVKPPLQAPPLPGEEPLVPLLGDLERARSLWEGDKPGTDPPLPPPICSLAQCDPQSCPLGPNRACLLQTFQDIQWRLCVYASQFSNPQTDAQSNKGLEIGQVYLRRLFVPNDPWQLILQRAGVAEIFTVYHDRRLGDGGGQIYDTQFLSGWNLGRRTVTPADAGPNGTLITLAQDASFGPAVVAECRDRGPAWLCKGADGNFGRRGQELAVWGVLDPGNYDFITEYGFRDDGTITMRVGATGWNNDTRPTEAHMHDVLWRIDMDLNGAGGDSAYQVEHIEPNSGRGLQAIDRLFPICDLPRGGPFDLCGVEGAFTWNPSLFTSLLVEDAAVNSLGEHLGYKLEPLRSGNARHHGNRSGHKENWTHFDFWVTQWHKSEATAWAEHPWKNPDDYLFPYVNRESVENQDLVLWYLASAHHDPTDEDRDSQGNWAVTLTHWFGLELHPHNFFDRNPLGGPKICR